jgi:predicted nucleic acid-binding protein
MIVVDANILIRAVLGRRVRKLLETYAERGVRFFAPQVAFDDAKKHLPALLKRRRKNDTDGLATIEYLQSMIESVESDLYEEYETDARHRLRGRDEDDWPILASALALACPVWTEDTDFFGTGVAVWTTSRIEIFLGGQATPHPPNKNDHQPSAEIGRTTSKPLIPRGSPRRNVLFPAAPKVQWHFCVGTLVLCVF